MFGNRIVSHFWFGFKYGLEDPDKRSCNHDTQCNFLTERHNNMLREGSTYGKNFPQHLLSVVGERQ